MDYLVIFFILFKAIEGNDAVVLIKPPVSQNVSEGSVAVFNCTGISDDHYWLVNDKISTHSSNSHRGLTSESIGDDLNDVRVHLLSVPAMMVNNDISIKCFIFSVSVKSSDAVTLQIQGSLGPVTELHAVWVDSSSILVSFTPPYTLDGVPIRNYTIELDSSTVYTTNTTSTVISVNNSCTDHNITVTAWNDAGEGNETNHFLLPKGLTYPLKPSNTTLQYTSTNDSQPFQVMLQYSVLVGFPWTPSMVVVYLDGDSEVTMATTMSTTCTMNTALTLDCDNVHFNLSEHGKLSINITEYIQPGYQYNVTVSLTNCIGTTNSSQYSFSIASSTSMVSPTSSTSISDDGLLGSSFSDLITSTSIKTTYNSRSETISLQNSNDVIVKTSTSASLLTSWLPGTIVALCLFCGVLIITVVALMAILMKYKKRNRKLKDAEMNAHEKHRNAQVILDSITVCTPSPHSIDPSGNAFSYNEPSSSSLPVENPQYETLDDVQSPAANYQLELMKCPAYGALPLKKDS